MYVWKIAKLHDFKNVLLLANIYLLLFIFFSMYLIHKKEEIEINKVYIRDFLKFAAYGSLLHIFRFQAVRCRRAVSVMPGKSPAEN